MFLYIFDGYNTSLIQSVIWWQLHDIILYFYGHNLVQNSTKDFYLIQLLVFNGF